MKVSDLGEFGLIQRLASAIGAEAPPALIIGIGDDCAVWQFGNEYLLATTDTLVEGVHFSAGRSPAHDIGWKALAVNVSDIAAMGGEPLLALVTLSLPETTEVSFVESAYGGLAECAETYGVSLAGGDTVRSSQLAVTLVLIGRAQMRDGAPLLMRRDSARVGDVIAVTGTVGDSAAGLRRLADGAPPDAPLVEAHLRPRPPLGIAQEAARLGIHCAIDISDGLVQDLGHICEASRVSAALRAADIPISEAVRDAYPDDALALACAGGEDYQVVLVGTSGVMTAFSEFHPEAITVIGRITDAPVAKIRLLDRTGAEIESPGRGWDHLRAEGQPQA